MEEASSLIKLDELDFRILRELRINSRRSIRQFATAINENPSTVYNRINRLEDNKIIKKWIVALDFSLLNQDVIFYVFISVECEGCGSGESKVTSADICERIKDLPGICEISLITGDFDIFVKLRANSIDTVRSIILDQIRSIPAVSKVVSNNCYEIIRQECDVEELNLQSELNKFELRRKNKVRDQFSHKILIDH